MRWGGRRYSATMNFPGGWELIIALGLVLAIVLGLALVGWVLFRLGTGRGGR